jgi:hypothetical protein
MTIWRINDRDGMPTAILDVYGYRELMFLHHRHFKTLKTPFRMQTTLYQQNWGPVLFNEFMSRIQLTTIK